MTRWPVAMAVCLSVSDAAAQTGPYAAYDSARFAWEEGRYAAALEGFDRLLAAPGAERFLEPVALLTGELYHTVTVARDGRAVQWSPDGRFASYETGEGAERRIHVLRFESGGGGGGGLRPAVELAGFGLVFSPAGARAAYFSVGDPPELRAMRGTLDSLLRARALDERRRRLAEFQRLESRLARVVIRELASGRQREVAAPDLAKRGLAYGGAGGGDTLFLAASRADGDPATTDIYAIASDGVPRPVTEGPGLKGTPLPARDVLVYTIGPDRVAVFDLATRRTRVFPGTSPALSANGVTLVFLDRMGDTNTVKVLSLRDTAPPVVVARTRDRVASPALSPDGRSVAYQRMPREDWEIYVAAADGSGERRLTREIQHDVLPRFFGPDRVLGLMGEPRHRRSYLYDVVTGARTRLFHNNTVRTVAPEYAWAPSPDGMRLLVVADRDGDTVSPERGVFLVDLTRPVTVAEVRARLAESLAGERRLRAGAERSFALLGEPIRAAVADVSAARIFGYARELFAFDSKYITQRGNRLAIDYLSRTLEAFGYQPELQWFEPRPGMRTANVIATIRGSASPDVIYVVSSHFDSVEPGPGADDNSSGTTALLEAARVLAGRPQAATIRFAFFTGEEAGLLGSREFVRRAQAGGRDRIAGALNNDMIGWMNDQRLDNTIRYSNDGIRDIQHGAALLFTDLITYDSRYYQSTDAAAYYEAYGDIVGGIGSYPILGNPHYHQPHDVLETISHRLVGEVSKTTVATIMLLASSPARPSGLTVARTGGDTLALEWAPAPERDVVSYRLAWGPVGSGWVSDPPLHTITVSAPRATLTGVPPGAVVAVKAVNGRGLESWDWARVTVPPSRR
jgi:hypothetical protein